MNCREPFARQRIFASGRTGRTLSPAWLPDAVDNIPLDKTDVKI